MRPLRIGAVALSNPLILAPLAGITNRPFREICRAFGCALAYTEMVSANGLIRDAAKSFAYLDSSPADRPLGVQIFGAEPDLMAEAARIVTDRGADLLDINMGCPVKKVIRTGAGAALLREPDKAAAIVSAVRRATTLPLTVKIRSGWRSGERNFLHMARLAQDAGADALTLHPRTADMGFSGRADWGDIGAVKKSLTIPVIGNGDIRTAEDALRMMAETACDGVMIGRGALGHPWLFRDIREAGEGREPAPIGFAEREAVLRRHLAAETAYVGERHALRAFRKHLLWYTKGLRDGASFRDVLTHLTDTDTLWQAWAAFREKQISS